MKDTMFRYKWAIVIIFELGTKCSCSYGEIQK